jgi:hypothetical protein
MTRRRRPHWPRIAALAFVAVFWLLVALAVSAIAAPAASAATIHDDLDAAQSYWQSDVCRGQWQVVPDMTLKDRNAYGEATGIGFTYNPESGSYTDDNGHRWDWYIERCEFSMDPTLQGGERRCVVTHEVGHFVHGPAHVGPMAVDRWHGCLEVAQAAERAAARKASAERRRAKRAARMRARAARRAAR